MTGPREYTLNVLLEIVSDADTDVIEHRARVLAIQWPSLAAALANLLIAHDLPVPRSWRAAAVVLHEETYPTPEDDPEMAVGGAGSGAWCFCAAGGNEGGRGHLKGEGGCSRWCGCKGAAYPHLHDGTMPGNPVIT